MSFKAIDGELLDGEEAENMDWDLADRHSDTDAQLWSSKSITAIRATIASSNSSSPTAGCILIDFIESFHALYGTVSVSC